MTATATDRTAFEYRPHLDGLRTIAVYLVVVFHAGADRLSGGFIGVDLFFVLSGYLVTHVLIADLWSSGTFSLARFYGRRVRRLLPVAAVTLVATGALYTRVASPVEVAGVADSFRAAFLYVANWHFIGASTDYFAADLDANPVLHYWSLAIEEQFYLAWPIALVGLTALRRRLPRGDLVVRGLVAVLVVASALWALHLAEGNVNRAYYGTDTRAYQLLAGALLAMSATRLPVALGNAGRRAAAALGGASLLAIGVLATSLLEVGPITRGILTTVVAVVALSSLELADPAGAVRRVLSTDALTYLGRISYGTYLWHWPVIIVLARLIELSPLATAVIAGVVATGLAALSSRLLELPIRRSAALQRIPRLVAVGGVTASALVGLLLMPRVLDTGSSSGVLAASASAEAEVGGVDIEEVDWQSASTDRAERVACLDSDADDCRVVDSEGDAPRVVLLGDSHGVMLRPTFEAIAERRGYDLYVPAGFGCSWHIGLGKQGRAAELEDLCFAAQDEWYGRILPEIEPDLVVVVQRAVDDPASPVTVAGRRQEGDDQHELLVTTAETTIDTLRDLGYPAVVVEPIPVARPDDDPLRCLSTAETIVDCRYVATTGPTPLEAFYATQAGNGISVVDIDRIVCPYLPICDPIVDGHVVKWDHTHLTTAFARAMSDEVEELLDAAGALPPPSASAR